MICFFHTQIEIKVVNLLFDKFNIVLEKDSMLVHFVSVGQGDATVFKFPDGKTMLVDTGPKGQNVSYTNYLEENVINNKFGDKIDYLILTHADADHIGATLRVLNNFEIKKLYMPKIGSDTETYKELKLFVESNYKYEWIEEYQLIKGDDYEIQFFVIEGVDDTNDSCPLIKVECNDFKFLLAGDISSEIELVFIEEFYGMLDCDVLKVAHHGSAYSTSQEFLNATTPKCAVISVGVNNGYGHPTDEVLFRLDTNGIDILRTDLDGDVLFAVSDIYGCKIKTGDFIVSGFNYDIRLLVLFVDAVLIYDMLIALFKRGKKKRQS